MRLDRRGRSGQATVEMAVVLPVLIWLLVGMVDIGRMVSGQLVISNAAREAVRLGITGADDAAIAQRVWNLTTALEAGTVSVAISPPGFRNSGSDVTVTVTYNYKVMALMSIVGTNIPLKGTITGRVE